MTGKRFSAFALLALLAIPSVQAQESLPPQFCFTDTFGFVWSVQVTGNTGGGNLSVGGSVDIGGGDIWSVSGTVNRNSGAANLTATNPTPDNCNLESGLFNYVGNFVPAGGGTYNGSGDWTNDCGLSGEWEGVAIRGACRAIGQPAPGLNPASSQNAVAAASATNLETTPSGYALSKSYPNPFSSATSITYQLPEAQQVRISVYDVLGREVAMLVNETMEAGLHTAQWTAASSLPAGTYLYRMTAGSYSEVRQMMLVK